MQKSVDRLFLRLSQLFSKLFKENKEAEKQEEQDKMDT